MKKFPYKPPQKPASGKVEYVPLVEVLVGGSAQVAKLGVKAAKTQLESLATTSAAETLKKAHENKGKGAEGLKNIFFKKGGKMPLKKAKGKADMQKAVSANIQELTRANREKPAGKKRSKEQIAAIAYSAARKK
jgi:hypothetical protein